MRENERTASTNLPPGALTALLRDVFRASTVEGGSVFPALRTGEVVGRFEIVREIGRGGFGVVYEARDRELGRAVALKAVRMGGDVELKGERLLREAEAAAQLSHPNIVTLHDIGRSERGPYLVMELLRGSNLGARIEGGALPVRTALRIAVEVAKALAHAHANGVVHRDLTPGNVFICADGQVKVLDFGMAQAVGRRTLHGGTRDYMAPEQRRGAPEDERTDVFALGVMLHEMLAGSVPFPDGGVLDDDDPPRLEMEAVPALAELVARMIDRDPVKRPRDGQEVLAALGALEESVARVPSGALEARVQARRRVPRPVIATVAGAVVLGAVALALASVGDGTRAEARGAPLVGAAADLAGRLPAPASAGDAAATDVRTGPAPAAAPRRTEAARSRGGVRYCRGTVNAVATPAPAAGDGVLTIEADPFGDVFVNGRRYGETPSECRLSAGTYAVRVLHPQYGTREGRVEVTAGKRTRWTADFVAGR